MHEDDSHRGTDPGTPAGSESGSTLGSLGRRSGWLGGLGVLAAVAAVHFFREPASYLLPPLSYEDGRDFFAFFYNHREPAAILRFYAGYVSLIPNLVGYLVLALPTLWVTRVSELAWPTPQKRIASPINDRSNPAERLTSVGRPNRRPRIRNGIGV